MIGPADVARVLSAHRFEASWGVPNHRCSCGGWETVIDGEHGALGHHELHVASVIVASVSLEGVA